MKDALIKFDYLWPIVRTIYNAKVRKIFALSRVDRIICGLVLNSENGEIYFDDLGLLLGFGTRDILDFSNTIKFYKDKAEINILNSLIEKCSKFHLLDFNKETSIVKITDWGIHAIEYGKKYEFWDCTLSSYSHVDFKLDDHYNYYPFFKLGLTIDINPEKLLCEVYDFPAKRNDLTKESIYDLSHSEQNVTFIIDDVDDQGFTSKTMLYRKIDVYLNKNQKSLEFYYRHVELDLISASISLVENRMLQAHLQRKGLYVYLLGGNELLTPFNLAPFMDDDFFKPINVIKTGKVDWNSKDIFAFFLNESYADNLLWTEISSGCPIELILQNIDQLVDYVSWIILTQRVGSSEVLDRPNLNWDFELIIEMFSEEELLQFLEKRLLEVPKVSDDIEAITYFDVISIYTWNLITEKLSDENLEKHIFDYPFNLRYITINREALCKKLLLENGKWEKDVFSREWDWRYISGNYDPEFLSKNFALFKNHLDASNLFLQIAKSEIRLTRFLKSNQTVFLKEKLAKDSFKLASHHEVFLNEVIIDLLEQQNLLTWGVKALDGFEANAGITWTNSLVRKYGHKIQSNKSFELISSRLDKIETAIDNNQLSWDWISIVNHFDIDTLFDNWLKIHDLLNAELQSEAYSFLSEKLSLSQAIELCKKIENIQGLINWESISRNSSKQDLENFYGIMNDLLSKTLSQDLVSLCTQKISIEYILLNKELLWDWSYVSRKKIVLADAERYFNDLAPFLDWEYITENLYNSKELNNIESLTKLAWYIDKGKESLKKPAWEYITKQINPELIWVFVNSTRDTSTYHWDWNVISESPIFLKGQIEDLRNGDDTFFIENSHFLNWTAFTSNPHYAGYLEKKSFEKFDDWIMRIEQLISPLQSNLDWEILSSNLHLTKKRTIINKYYHHWDWRIFTKSSQYLIKRRGNRFIFNYENINRLSKELDYYILSSRSEVSIEDHFIESYGHENLNWEYLSSNRLFQFSWKVFFKNGDINGEVRQDNNYQPIIEKVWDFRALSKRRDASLTSELVLRLMDKNWDWQYFSSQRFISNNLLLETVDKDWNWVLVSQNPELIFDEKLIRILIEKDSDDNIDWSITSSNPYFHISNSILSMFPEKKLKSLDWDELSRSKNLDIGELNSELLNKYSAHWNWGILLKEEKISLSSKLLLESYKDIPGSTIAQYIKPQVIADSSLESIKKYIDWNILCQREDFKSLLSNSEFISKNRTFLNWEIISNLTHIAFTIELINSFYSFWDWPILRKNPRIVENPTLDSYVDSQIRRDKRLLFLSKISQQNSKWSGYIYHFTHLSNAIKVLNSSTILSRSSALKKNDCFDDASGSVVNRRDLAHDYARFYFRPQTPTQFYNEELGQDQSSVYQSTYANALGLGLPKCPIPVFFRFRLKDILFDKNLECQITNGNMQTNWARPLDLEKAVHAFDFDKVYSKFPKYQEFGGYDGFDESGFREAKKTYIDKSQQEFLIRDKFDFSNYYEYEIIVKNDFTKQYLLDNLEDESQKKRIIVDNYDSDIFHNGNRSIQIRRDKTEIRISTDYCNKHRFKLIFTEPFEVDEIEGTNVILNNYELEFEGELFLNLKNEIAFKLEFYNELKSEPWDIIKYDYGN